MNDGSIRIGTKLDMSGLKKEIQALEKELKAVQKEADKLNTKEEKVKETFSAERDIDNQVDKRYSHSDDINKREAEALSKVTAQREELNQKAQEYNAMLEQANAKLQQQQAIAQASKDLDSAVKAEAILDKISTQEQYNSLLEQTQAKMAAIEDRARQIAEANNVSYEALLASNPTYQKLSDTMGVLTSTTREFKSEAESAGNSAKNGFRKAKKEANGLDGSIKKGIKSLSRMALAVFGIRGAYSLVRRAVSACLQGNEELNKKMTAIWNTLGTIMEPVVTAMMNAIYKILAYINYFVKAITGIDFVANANAKAIKKQAAATDKLTKSTKEANKALASFDEMNVLNDKTSQVSSVDQAATLDLPELTEEEKATLDGIVEVFNNVRDAIGEVKTKCSELIDWWNELDETTQIIIETLGIGGLVGILIGGKTGLGVFGAILAVCGTIEAFNLLLTGDTTDAVDAFIILLGVAGLVGILIGGTTGWTVGAAIMAVAMILTSFNLLVNGDTTDAILGLILLLGGSGLAGYLWGGVKGISVGIAVASVIAIFNGLNDLLSGDTETAIKGVIKILTGSAGLIFAFNATKAAVTGATGLQAVLAGLKSPLLIVALGVAVLLAGIVELSKNWNKLSGGQKAITILASLAAAAIAAAVAFAAFHTAWSAGAAAIAIAAGLAVLGVSLAGISSAFAKNAVEDSVTETANSFANSTDFSSNPLPKLAVGGIVNRPGRGVHAIVGEAGAEAVLPLENNTEWMDILAEKIGGNITIPIYMDGKKIATYVVDIQKKKAFAMNGAW